MLHGFSVAGYRSFGPEPQKIIASPRINLIIGKNNVGKSNTLRVLSHILPKLTTGQSPAWNNDLDNTRYNEKIPPNVGLFVPTDTVLTLGSGTPNVTSLTEPLTEILKSRSSPGIWFEKAKISDNWEDTLGPASSELFQIFQQATHRVGGITTYAGRLTGTSSNERNDFLRLLSLLSPFRRNLDAALIPAIRSTKLSQTDPHSIQDDLIYVEGIVDFGGFGLLERLFKLQNPDFTERKSEQRFRSLTTFLQTILGNTSATISVPHTKKSIYLSLDGKRLPLSSYGSGIEQVVIIAAAATVLEQHVIYIEEPETNLHPEFQMRLLNFLRDKTENQYFITTHSSSAINLDGSSTYMVRLGSEGSKVRQLLSATDHHDLVFDLGYRPSDLAQSNCVIWVEGPSDRLYLKHAIESEASDLIEGTDYSILFFGGKLLSHLSVTDEQIDQFINLTQINRRSAIVIDSDRSSEDMAINETKKRIIKEFSEKQLFVWLTKGREIENYIPPAVLSASVAQTHPGASLQRDGQFDDVCQIVTTGGKITGLNKIKVAHEVINSNNPAKFRFDWDERITELLAFIRAAA
jgi:AAA15 family ATPase/GTPase